jgi:hypothetical protein
VKNSTNPLFCNKGMASARPQTQQNESWALAPEDAGSADTDFFTKLFKVVPQNELTTIKGQNADRKLRVPVSSSPSPDPVIPTDPERSEWGAEEPAVALLLLRAKSDVTSTVRSRISSLSFLEHKNSQLTCPKTLNPSEPATGVRPNWPLKMNAPLATSKNTVVLSFR